MSKRAITITVGTSEDMAKEAIKIWHQIEAGQTPKQVPIEKIRFPDERTLFKTLTTSRCGLLRYVHENGKLSIRAISKGLHRVYSNVYQDIRVLSQAGLIFKDEKDKKYYVPWDVIITEIPMTLTPNDQIKGNFKSSKSTPHSRRRIAHG